jgi:mRNA-degrading endonuclease RelE of RelBE toxin-antitoxin system
MTSADAYDVRLSQAAVRAFERLPQDDRDAIRAALKRLGLSLARPGQRGGKTIQGTSDTFHRLRAGDHRVMYDVLHDERTVLVLGIVNRRDLDRWLRQR